MLKELQDDLEIIFCINANDIEKNKIRGVNMAVPKSKQSKSRTNKRFANYKATAATIVECPHCHELTEAHRGCKSCGFYDGKEVVAQHDGGYSTFRVDVTDVIEDMA